MLDQIKRRSGSIQTARYLTVEQVQSWGMQTHGVGRAEEALMELRRAHAGGIGYHIVVVDDQMPDMTGEQLAAQAQGDPALRDLVFVMLTTRQGPADMGRLRDLGFAAYLHKPVRQSDFFATLVKVWEALSNGRGLDIVTRQTVAAIEPMSGVAHSSHAHVLLVEDNATNQRVASLMLRNIGCRVDVAADGLEALRMLEHRHYDAIFMDCEMPEMDGYDATAAIRARGDAISRVPIIGVTAQAMRGDRERCLRAGMNDYLKKPVQPEALAAALQRWAPSTSSLPSLPLMSPLAKEDPQDSGLGELDAGAAPLDEGVMRRLRELSLEEPELLADILQSFLVDAVERIAGLRAAQTAGDAQALRSLAHVLKGASLNVGASGMTALARKLESMGHAGATAGAGALIDALDRERARVHAQCAEWGFA